MAKMLMLTTASKSDPRTRPWAWRDFDRLSGAVSADRFRQHEVTADPEAAAVILFVGPGLPDWSDIRSHPFVRRFREKCFVFDTTDKPVAFLPGIYACADTRWHGRRAIGGFYPRVFENHGIDLLPADTNRPWLFSFIGTVDNAAVRRNVAGLKHPRAFVLDTSGDRIQQTDASDGENNVRWRRYIQAMAESHFILCPRGIGTSTWRLFEAMKAGRVPVILSDRWLAPSGPRWETFSVRIRERDVRFIPERLAAIEHRSSDMGLLARRAWEDWFSRETAFHRVSEWCLQLLARRTIPEHLVRFAVLPELLRPYNLRHVVPASIRARLKP